MYNERTSSSILAGGCHNHLHQHPLATEQAIALRNLHTHIVHDDGATMCSNQTSISTKEFLPYSSVQGHHADESLLRGCWTNQEATGHCKAARVPYYTRRRFSRTNSYSRLELDTTAYYLEYDETPPVIN
jgi:hypothetical protein